MHVVFLNYLSRAAPSEAAAIAASLGVTEYEARLALAAAPPAILLTTPDANRASDAAAALRARGHGAQVFDEAFFVASSDMIALDDFRFEPDGIRRGEDLLPFGDLFAVLRGVHDAEDEEPREHVAYFFRRTGERPWILRELHASYVGLGEVRAPVAFSNFTRTLARIREASPTAIFDDRLVRRLVAERLRARTEANPNPRRSSRDGMDLLAHLLATGIASLGGSPYR